MNWPILEDISAMSPLPAGDRFEAMTSADIAPLIAAIRAGFPGVSVDAASCNLTAPFLQTTLIARTTRT